MNPLCLECSIETVSTNYDIEDLDIEHQFMLISLEVESYRVCQCPRCKIKVPVIHSRYNKKSK